MNNIIINKENGITNLRPLYSFFRAIKDGSYMISIRRIRKRRTDNQNDWLWGAIYPLLLEGLLDAGWDFKSVEQVHEFFKGMIAEDDVVNYDTGEIIKIPKSTANMDTVEFSTYVQKLREYAEEYLNITIPEPDKNWRKTK